ncbi:hypothetical protein, partial [Xenorhabdus szentirmaii]|uniref:hypothetical protein n=1 Tax=Xenorhabdus szentirmaii TaxID=290112 RepID=UPI002B40FAD3
PSNRLTKESRKRKDISGTKPLFTDILAPMIQRKHPVLVGFVRLGSRCVNIGFSILLGKIKPRGSNPTKSFRFHVGASFLRNEKDPK